MLYMEPQVYRYFMTGDDGRCEEEDDKQAAEFEARAAAVRSETERLQAVRAAAWGAAGRIVVVHGAGHG
jgi:hypothetical protein